MRKERLETFSDGVLAIIITIMVLEMKVPHGSELSDIKPILPVAMSYILSFVYIGIYWNNHHHMLHAARHINGKIMWANMHLLFWLSLVPFGSGWRGENNFNKWPVILYGVILLMNGVAYFILSRMLIQLHGENSTLAVAIGKDTKGILSIIIYALAIALAFVHPVWSLVLYTVVAIMWLIPDKRIEKKLEEKEVKKE